MLDWTGTNMCGVCNKIRDVTTSGNYAADGVIYGDAWKGPITYAFTLSAENYSYANEPLKNFEPASQQQADSALFALEQSFGNAANDGFSVEGFTKVSISAGSADSATLRFAQSDAPSTAYAYLPGDYEQAGDMWFGRNFDYTDASAGNYAWHTVLHEIGHALGLKHGHQSQNGFDALPTEYDSLEYSLMTYRSFVGGEIRSYTYSEWSAPQTYMMMDIAALQKLYGADFQTNSGDTVYSWSESAGDTLVNGEVGIDAGGAEIFATIWDGGGNDTYDLSSYTTNLVIDLAVGGHSTFSEDQLASLGFGNSASGNIYNALLYKGDRRSLIENVTGGGGNDNIAGNVAANILVGGAGNDTLSGLQRADTLKGGEGADTLDGGDGRDILYGDSGDDILTGGLHQDAFHFAASGGADIITDFVNGVDKLVIDIDGFDLAAAILNAVQTGLDLAISLGETDSITLLNFDKADLGVEDFLTAL